MSVPLSLPWPFAAEPALGYVARPTVRASEAPRSARSSTTDVVASGTADADPDADLTVHAEVEGLSPCTAYHYAFEALGERSPIARTRTLPPRGADHLRIAMVSCANYAAGFFNGYGRIAERDDLDFVLHLGDYIYEVTNRPPATHTVGPDIGRPYAPDNECVDLKDYRARYAHYQQDPDLMAMHHAHPVIGIVDDHEFADNVWREGSLEHRVEVHGPWHQRREAAFLGRWEWLPARRPDPVDPERVWRSVRIGDLADLILIDTRTRRDEPIDGPAQADPARSQLGPDQRAWFLGRLAESDAAWRLIGNSSVMGHIWDERLPAQTIPALMKLEMTNEAGTGPDPDQWDGYPAERDAILQAFGDAGDVVVLSGDVHIGLAMDIPRIDTTSDPSPSSSSRPAGRRRTSTTRWDGNRAPRACRWSRRGVEAVPYVKFADFDDHGYVIVDVTPEPGPRGVVVRRRRPRAHPGAASRGRLGGTSRRTRAGPGSLGADRTVRMLHSVADLLGRADDDGPGHVAIRDHPDGRVRLERAHHQTREGPEHHDDVWPLGMELPDRFVLVGRTGRELPLGRDGRSLQHTQGLGVLRDAQDLQRSAHVRAIRACGSSDTAGTR